MYVVRDLLMPTWGNFSFQICSLVLSPSYWVTYLGMLFGRLWMMGKEMEGEAVMTIYFKQKLSIQDSYSSLHLHVTEAELQSSPGDINDHIRHKTLPRYLGLGHT